MYTAGHAPCLPGPRCYPKRLAENSLPHLQHVYSGHYLEQTAPGENTFQPQQQFECFHWVKLLEYYVELSLSLAVDRVLCVLPSPGTVSLATYRAVEVCRLHASLEALSTHLVQAGQYNRLAYQLVAYGTTRESLHIIRRKSSWSRREHVCQKYKIFLLNIHFTAQNQLTITLLYYNK